MQENEADDMNIDPSKDVELAEMLEGKNEHLYQRILYLVLADAAYFEGIHACSFSNSRTAEMVFGHYSSTFFTGFVVLVRSLSCLCGTFCAIFFPMNISSPFNYLNQLSFPM